MLGRQSVILAAERDDLVRGVQPGEPGDPVRLKPRARDQAIGADGAAAVSPDRNAGPVLRNGGDAGAEHQRRAQSLQAFGHCATDALVIDDPGSGHEQRPETADIRLNLAQTTGGHRFEDDVVLPRTVLERGHALYFEGIGRDEEFPAGLERDPVVATELLGRDRALAAEPGLQRAGLVVDAGVDDAAVVAGLVLAEIAAPSRSARSAPGRPGKGVRGRSRDRRCRRR